MALPKLIDEIKIKRWTLELKKPHKCFLYDFKSMGITSEQFADIIIDKPAYVFEKPFQQHLRGYCCPWCEYDSRKMQKKGIQPFWHGVQMQDHLYVHKKNLVSYQVLKFQQELYTLRLQLVREGWHECMAFLVQHECQFCISPRVKGRKGMCSIPSSTRNRMRSLKTLSYPIKHIKKKRMYEWSCLGIIVLIKV